MRAGGAGAGEGDLLVLAQDLELRGGETQGRIDGDRGRLGGGWHWMGGACHYEGRAGFV